MSFSKQEQHGFPDKGEQTTSTGTKTALEELADTGVIGFLKWLNSKWKEEIFMQRILSSIC